MASLLPVRGAPVRPEPSKEGRQGEGDKMLKMFVERRGSKWWVEAWPESDGMAQVFGLVEMSQEETQFLRELFGYDPHPMFFNMGEFFEGPVLSLIKDLAVKHRIVVDIVNLPLLIDGRRTAS